MNTNHIKPRMTRIKQIICHSELDSESLFETTDD